MAKLIHAAFVTYLLSYALPAVVIAGDLAFGFQAAILSFVGSYIGLGTAEHLERGQTPACLLGALANVLMVGGYVCYNLRRFSKRMRPFCLVASWLAGSAAVCALGAAVFLATGSEAFIPSIGYFVWLASMIIMSFACWKLGKTVKCEPGAPPRDGLTTQVEGSSITEEPDRSTDIPAKRPPKLPHWLIWTIPSLVLGLIVVLTGARFLHRQHIRRVDERIVIEVEDALISKLRSLSEDDEITQRYGKFIELTNVSWDRPRYAWQLIVRLDWSATAHFEKAQARITLGIDRGETLAIERLEMRPSEEWRREHPELAGEFVLIDGELWVVNEQSKTKDVRLMDGQGIQIFSTIEESREQCTGAGSFFRFSKPEPPQISG